MNTFGHQVVFDEIVEARNKRVVLLAEAGDRRGNKKLEYHIGAGSYVVTVNGKEVYKDVQPWGAVQAYNKAT